MEIKQIEIRDRSTFIPALAMRISGTDGYLFRRAGFGASPCTLLMNLSTMELNYDPFSWKVLEGRTMHVAHRWIKENWDSLGCDDVVDVEFILGESASPKSSEREGGEPSIEDILHCRAVG